jgi:uncharacterized protein YbcI
MTEICLNRDFFSFISQTRNEKIKKLKFKIKIKFHKLLGAEAYNLKS